MKLEQFLEMCGAEHEKKKRKRKRKGKIDEAIDFKNLLRYIPTGSKVLTSLGPKFLKITFIYNLSAPPLTTNDIKGIETRLRNYVKNFVKDIETVINFTVTPDVYIHMEGQKGSINFYYNFRLDVKNKAEVKKLAELEKAMK